MTAISILGTNVFADENSNILQSFQEDQTRLLSEYTRLFNLKDPNYKIDDPICKPIRLAEAQIENQKILELKITEDRIERKILSKCSESSNERMFSVVQNTVEAIKNISLADEKLLGEMSDRATHKSLSRETYELLNYPKLELVLKNKCPSSSPFYNDIERFRTNLVLQDLYPTIAGTVLSVVIANATLKGLSQLLWSPVRSQLTRFGVSERVFKISNRIKNVLLGTAIVGSSAGMLYVAKKKSENSNSQIEVENNNEKITLSLFSELTFPEPTLIAYAFKCENDLKSAYENISTTNNTLNIYSQLAGLTCKSFFREATRALKILNEPKNYCLPGNSGAEKRIIAKLNYMSEQWPLFRDIADKNNFSF
jgi:hypothetical protein